MSHAPFVPLRIFSSYTMLDGAIDPKDIGKAAKKRQFPAAALTDRNGLYAAMGFSAGCMKTGVQPVIGTMLAVERPDTPGTAPDAIDWLALYAQNETGYGNLCKLVSNAHLGRPLERDPHVSFEDLAAHADGLICLTAGGEGTLARLIAAGQEKAAQSFADRLVATFDDRLYIELCRRGEEIEEAAEAGLIALAEERGLPLVATNPCCFEEPGFHPAHDAMLCIAQSSYVESDDRRKSSPEAWLKSSEVMEDLFADVPEAIRNTIVVAQRCAFTAPKRAPILPSLAGDRDGESAQLRKDARAGLDARLSIYNNLSDEDRKTYYDRLDFELDIIIEMGFPGYFLIVADFIKWAKEQDIPVGPGRGSGAGSVVAWALTITGLDPLKLGLLFERFLNPERVSMPDFDIDFCETRRGEVIRYVQEKYGHDTVAQIITFGKLKARAVLKDTGRVLQMSYGQVDRLAKLVPNHPTDPWTLERALNGISDLAREYKQDDAVRRLFDMAKQLEGKPRHSSTHAAGVVIGDRPLDQLVPLYRDPRSDIPVTQFDMKNVEDAGLVKFDFLGLKTLSVLKEAVRLLSLRGIEVDLDTLAWDDEGVYQLLQRGDTVGVFQLESEGMRRTLSAVKPTAFGDIIALVSLYRPGPMDNIPLFGARKNGREEIAYPHPLLEQILAETYGIFVYQEQVMQAAQILAGYTLGQADLLRRAMGKKIQAEMDAQRDEFVAGCETVNGIPAARANELFDLIDKFAGYGFNKSHAAAYALLAYHTAWLKVHYPHEFFAASMTFDSHQTEKLSIFVDDLRRAECTLRPPCVNASGAEFTVEHDDGKIAVRYALGALKSVGEKAMGQLSVEREANGEFTSLDDFAERVEPRLLNRRQLEALAGSGAFDTLHDRREQVFAAADTILSVASSAANARETGQGGLFGGDVITAPSIQLPKVADWSIAERMLHEKDAYGFYFSAHPADQYRAIANANGVRSYAQICAMEGFQPGVRRPAVMAALVESARERVSQRGKSYCVVALSDRSGQYPASCFEESAIKALQEMAEKGECAMLNVELDMPEGEETPRIAVRSATPLAKLSENTPLVLEVGIDQPDAVVAVARLLGSVEEGSDTVVVRAISGDAVVGRVATGGQFAITPDLAALIERIPGVISANMTTRPPTGLA